MAGYLPYEFGVGVTPGFDVPRQAAAPPQLPGASVGAELPPLPHPILPIAGPRVEKVVSAHPADEATPQNEQGLRESEHTGSELLADERFQSVLATIDAFKADREEQERKNALETEMQQLEEELALLEPVKKVMGERAQEDARITKLLADQSTAQEREAAIRERLADIPEHDFPEEAKEMLAGLEQVKRELGDEIRSSIELLSHPPVDPNQARRIEEIEQRLSELRSDQSKATPEIKEA